MDFNLARKKYNNFLQAKEKKINTPHDFGAERDSKNHRIDVFGSRGSAYEQQLARRADPNNKLNRKRAKRKAKRRMAGERMEYEKNKYDKRKDYKMS